MNGRPLDRASEQSSCQRRFRYVRLELDLFQFANRFNLDLLTRCVSNPYVVSLPLIVSALLQAPERA